MLTDTHGRPVCADGQPQTATDVLCVLADTHGRPVCTEQTAHVALQENKGIVTKFSVTIEKNSSQYHHCYVFVTNY